MFVFISNDNENVIELDGWIKRTRNANKGVITPEFAMEILSKTNHFALIKNVLNNIKKVCSDEKDVLVPEKLLAYKEFILSCVDGRETSNGVMNELKNIASLCNFEDEFKKVNQKNKLYKKGFCATTVVRSKDDYDALMGSDLIVYFDSDEFDLSKLYLERASCIYFKKKSDIKVSQKNILPRYFDASNCFKLNIDNCDMSNVDILKLGERSRVTLSTVSNIPVDTDFSKCIEVNLLGLDLSNMSNLKFRKEAHLCLNNSPVLPNNFDASGCAVVNFNNVIKMPEVLDLSNARVVDLSNCDFNGVKEIKFKEGAKVRFYNAKNLACKMDTSMCANVDFAYEHYKENGNLLNETIDEKEAIKTEVLDFSNCKEVDLEGADLKGVKEIKFMKGASVNLRYAKNLPKTLDFSECEIVDMFRTNLSGVRDMKFAEGSIIALSDCDLRRLNLVFPANSKVDLSWSKNINSTLDVSLCSEVNLCRCDLRRVKDLKLLHERTWLNIAYAKNLPGYLDFVNCTHIDMVGVDLRGVREIKLKSRGFYKEDDRPLVWGTGKNFKGKYVYADELETNEKENETLLSRMKKRLGSGGMEM